MCFIGIDFLWCWTSYYSSEIWVYSWISVWNFFFFLDEADDDDDDPEYNFLEDLDEPDTEDFRTDRAVRITSESVCVMSPALDFSTSSFVYFAEFWG